MLAHFQSSAEAVGTRVKRFPEIADAVSYVREIAAGGGMSCSWLPPDVRQAFGGTEFAEGKRLADARICISWAEAAIAATGSLLLDLSGGHDRSAASLAPVHAVFVHESTLRPDMYALQELLGNRLGSSPTSRLAIVTGPSRTADIERVLTIGVHGPKELHVLLLEGA